MAKSGVRAFLDRSLVNDTYCNSVSMPLCLRRQDLGVLKKHPGNSGLACDVDLFLPRLKLPCSTHTSQSHSPSPSDSTSSFRAQSEYPLLCSSASPSDFASSTQSRKGRLRTYQRLTLQQLLQPPMSYAQAAAKGPKQSPEEVRLLIQNLDYSSADLLHTNPNTRRKYTIISRSPRTHTITHKYTARVSFQIQAS